MAELIKAQKSSLHIDTVHAFLKDLGVELVAQIVPESPLTTDTPLPDDLRDAMQSAHDICTPCILYNASWPKAVGQGVGARCTGFAEPVPHHTYSDVINKKYFNQAAMRIVGPRVAESSVPVMTAPCGITPFDIFIANS